MVNGSGGVLMLVVLRVESSRRVCPVGRVQVRGTAPSINLPRPLTNHCLVYNKMAAVELCDCLVLSVRCLLVVWVYFIYPKFRYSSSDGR